MGGPGKAKKQRIEALKKANEALERSRQVSAPENEENDVFEVVDCFLNMILEQWRLNAIERESKSIPLRPNVYLGNAPRTKRRNIC